ncbi:MAG: hypothetical protein ABSA76_00970 [Bacteroidales bacterium]
MTAIWTWIKNNILLSAGIALLLIVFLFGRKLKHILFGSHRVKHRPGYSLTHSRSGRLLTTPYHGHSSTHRPHGSLPRSVGTHKGNGYPAAAGGTIPFKYNKDGTIKKAWQVAGTVAAKHRMSKLRHAR